MLETAPVRAGGSEGRRRTSARIPSTCQRCVKNLRPLPHLRLVLAALLVSACGSCGRHDVPGTPGVTPVSSQDPCAAAAARLARRLDDDCRLVIRSPFVLAGDIDEAELKRWHDQVIVPTSRALRSSYFDSTPQAPVTVLLFGDEVSYRRYALQLFGDRNVSYYGYYKPSRRTLVVNITTGGGTLVHELTHAWLDAEFPDAPAWFNEGLASLHESCLLRKTQGPIVGQVNWRLPALQQAIRAGKLRPLEDMMAGDDFRSRRAALNYAAARYFCMYMQQRGVLQRCYRLLRDNHARDPHGLACVQAVFDHAGWQQLNSDFRRWAAALELPQ